MATGDTDSNLRRGVRAVGRLLVLTFALVAVALVAVALLARTDDGVTRVADRPVMTVLSDSMTPTFKAGDVLVEESVKDRADELPVGTVITFRSNNGLVTHRIISVSVTPGGEVAYRTQGDANNVVDATPVKADQVVGVYSWHVPKAGYVLNELRTPRGLSVLLFALSLFVLLPVLAKWWRAAGGEPERQEAAEGLEAADVS